MDSAGLGTSFVIFRVLQILTLIPCWAILASVISLYNQKFVPAPGGIICLFIVAILLTVWSFCILITYLRAFNTAMMIVFFDVVGMITLIVGVALLSNEANSECVNVAAISGYYGTGGNNDGLTNYLSENSVTKVTGGTYGDYCGMLRGSWGLGIANIVFFFLTAILGAQIADTNEDVIVRESRHGKRASLVEERVVSGRHQPEVVEVIKTTRRPSGSGAGGSKSHRVGKHDHHHHKGDRRTGGSSKTMTTHFYV